MIGKNNDGIITHRIIVMQQQDNSSKVNLAREIRVRFNEDNTEILSIRSQEIQSVFLSIGKSNISLELRQHFSKY